MLFSTSGEDFWPSLFLQGLPVDVWTVQQTVLAYWIMGSFLGHAVSQNAKRHLVGHVKDINLPGGHYDPVNRVYATRYDSQKGAILRSYDMSYCKEEAV